MSKAITESIVSAKQARSIVLVPNREILQQRVAADLQAKADGSVILAPPVFMFSVWVESTAVRLRQLAGRVVPHSFSAASGLAAWMETAPARIQVTGAGFALNAARQARAADRLLRQWKFDDDSAWLDEEFYRWRGRLRAYMSAQAVFSGEDWLEDLLLSLQESGELPMDLPQVISLEGFIELTPLERDFLSALEAHGVKVHQGGPQDESVQAQVFGFETPEQEWQAAATWAKSRVDSGARNLAVVIPAGISVAGPTARRVRQAFSAAFHPRAAAALNEPAMVDFHISQAGRLSQCPSVIDAFALVRLALHGEDAKHDFKTVSQWLLSPHWSASDREYGARAQLEWRLRQLGLFRLSLSDVVRQIACTRLEDSLVALIQCVEEVRHLPATATAGSALHRILYRWGWPGSGRSGVLDLQAKKFVELLEQLDEPGFDLDEGTLQFLETLCADIVLPFGGGALSPVQILTPEVAAGGQFEGLWLCHADDSNWPPPVTSNSLLPAAARTGIPRMNPEGQYHHYNKLTQMLFSTAPEIRVSWSRDAGHGPRRKSGLVEAFESVELEKSVPVRLSSTLWPNAGQKALDGAPVLETIEDVNGIAFPSDGPVDLPGGSEFFRLQAACPLWAYLTFRLAAGFPPMPGPLPDALFRGSLLHRAMCALYARGGDARGFPDRGMVAGAVSEILANPKVGARLTPTALRAEEGRLRRALSDWLKFEAPREAFAVAGLEVPFTLQLGRASLNVRLDRIDRLADGRQFIIDYKSSSSGASKALKWLRPRLQEPQLPLYATFLDAGGDPESGGVFETAGLALATVKFGQCEFDGISDDPASELKGIRVVGQGREPLRSQNWTDLVAQWRFQVESLLQEILTGVADNRVHDKDLVERSDLALILRQHAD